MLSVRRASLSGLKPDRERRETTKALGNLSRRISGILHNLNLSEKSRNIYFVPLDSRNDWHSSEAFSIKELYESTELQSTGTRTAPDCTDNRQISQGLKSDCTSLSPVSQITQKAFKSQETEGCCYSQNSGTKVSFQEHTDKTCLPDFQGRPSPSEKSAIFSQSVLRKPASPCKSQLRKLEVEQDHPEIKCSAFQDASKEQMGSPDLLQVENLRTSLESGQLEYTRQIDPVENLIGQLRRELVFLRSQVRHCHSMCKFISCNF